jgi:MinD-like ATPase involved in chromosome partitioning or flagellar assembly
MNIYLNRLVATKKDLNTFQKWVNAVNNTDGLFDLGGSRTPHAKMIYVVSNKGGVGKTSLALNLGCDLAYLTQKRILLADRNGGQTGVKGRLKKLDKHPYGWYEYIVTNKGLIDINYRANQKEHLYNAKSSGLQLAPVSENRDVKPEIVYHYKFDDQKPDSPVLDIFPQHGGVDVDVTQLMSVRKFLTDSDFRKKEMKELTGNFADQWRNIDAYYDYIVVDMPSTMDDGQDLMVMRKYQNNTVFVVLDPNDVESFRGSIPYVQGLFSGKTTADANPNMMIVFNEEPLNSQAMNEASIKKFVEQKYENVDLDVLNNHFKLGTMIRDKNIKMVENSKRFPWSWSKHVDENTKIYLRRLSQYVIRGQYEAPKNSLFKSIFDTVTFKRKR